MTAPPADGGDPSRRRPASSQPWPDRLRASADELYEAAARLRDAVGDPDGLARLTDPSASERAAASAREFDALLETALRALVDLAGYDNPEQDYPDLAPWFEFRCRNVVYGRHTDTIRRPEPPTM